jgi:hypothetical protein
MFQERDIKPRGADYATRAALVWLFRAFNWRDAIVVVKPARESQTNAGHHSSEITLTVAWPATSSPQ